MTERDLMLDLLKDEGAADLVEALGSISQAWDDAIDSGSTTVLLSRAFTLALVGLPEMPFYREHRERLLPLMRASIIDWLAANELERGSHHDRTLAFTLRDSLIGVVQECVVITRGLDFAITNAATLRRAFHDEPLDQYLGGLT